MQLTRALRAMSFDTGREVSRNSGNWMTLADEAGAASGALCNAKASRSALARRSGSLIVEAMDKSSCVSIPFLYADCYSSPRTFHESCDILLGKHSVVPRRFVNHVERSSACSFSKIASIMYACQDGFTMRFLHARSMRSLISSFRRSWKFLVLGCASSCVATLPPFSIKALIIASLACCGFDRIGIFSPYCMLLQC